MTVANDGKERDQTCTAFIRFIWTRANGSPDAGGKLHSLIRLKKNLLRSFSHHLEAITLCALSGDVATVGG